MSGPDRVSSPTDADGVDLDEVRSLLAAHTWLEELSQGGGDTELMKLCCVQLSHAGDPHDVLLVWRVKSASMDADCSIGLPLLCGSGLATTRAYPSSRCSPEAGAALRRLIRGEEAGDFEDFCVEGHSARYAAHCAT
ncbi:hypothetical protein CP969_07645 [Streptomyces viridosporus T7A]|uniref:Uncharacterized protein n=1 Tax=Streptomyces viridosporus T7A TaxID=665577 RepID=A0ABX6ABT1_STRVD|nr:hypothetical protein CP969_07645 [Streptomyces viridosporus T7A]